MKRAFLTLALLLVLGSATFVKADPVDLREPSFPGAGAGEGDLMAVGAPVGAGMIGKAVIAGVFWTVSLYW